MGFPNERESGTESTPRRSRRAKGPESTPRGEDAPPSPPRRARGEDAQESGPRRARGEDVQESGPRRARAEGTPDSAPRRARGEGEPESTPRRSRRAGSTESAPRLSRKERKAAEAAEADGGTFAGAFTPADTGAAPPSGAPPYGFASGPGPAAAGGAEPKADERVETGPTHRTWSPYDEENRSRGPLWAVLGGVAVLALLGGGLALMFNADDPGAAATDASRRTSAPIPTGPAGKYGYAGARRTDPDPLTVRELFKSKKVTVAGRAYQLTITSKDKKCGDGVLGTKIAKALKTGKCTQMMRASFRDKSGKVIGTVGVANLNTSKNATKVARAAGAADYVKPLAGKDEITKFLGSGSGGAKVWTHGHYAVMVWFQTKDGVKPDKKVSKTLFQAADDITKATVFKALDARTLTGARAT
ncbi:hypothetical protein [Nonomuraea glycinis]|uniref:hypothetical protein n=1 Tax=Nonomuraea glycinis TaxID=2047744 RepID=UPI002E13E1A3|nr:hypothetical protein OHA68_19085 [Nonomuraea glycinis]